MLAEVTCAFCFDSRHYRCRGCACSICGKKTRSVIEQVKKPKVAVEPIRSISLADEAKIIELLQAGESVAAAVRQMDKPEITRRKVYRLAEQRGLNLSVNHRGSTLSPQEHEEVRQLLIDGVSIKRTALLTKVSRDRVRTVKYELDGLGSHGQKFKGK